jgi:hypothetical protein
MFDGMNWTFYNISNSSFPNNKFKVIEIDNLGNKWIGTDEGRIVKFDGMNWVFYNSSNFELPCDCVEEIAIDNLGNKWIGTYGGGLAVYHESGVVKVDEKSDEKIPTEFILAQNYPNPFNPTTKIKYSIPKESFVKIAIYDILGKEIATLVNEGKPTGNYEIQFNASNLPSGVYFYRMQAGNFIETKKMVLIK